MSTDRETPAMSAHREYSNHYFPHLSNCIVAVLTEGKKGTEKGSGVLVNVRGRHFVATAGHCIKRDTRVVMSAVPLGQNEAAPGRLLRVIREGKNETEEGVVPVRDVGYLEVEDPKRLEVQWDQLTEDRIEGGPAVIAGVPQVLDRIDSARRELSIGLAVFTTSLLEETEDYLKFDFPHVGAVYRPATDEWAEKPFPEHPIGFSGGGCFGVSETKGSHLDLIQYHLLGIQFDWLDTKRYVRVAPIRLWKELLRRDGLHPQ